MAKKKNFERFIYVGDIHGSSHLSDFIEKYDDGKTKFFFLGDYTDRGFNLYRNYLLMKRLVKEGKLEFVIGNHDMFFIFAEGLRQDGSKRSKMQETILKQGKSLLDFDILRKYYNGLKDINGGEQNDRGTAIYLTDYEKEGLVNAKELEIAIKEKNKEIADFFWEHGQLYIIDDRNNFLIHGGIPILPSGHLVGGIIPEKGEMLYGVDYIKELNKGFKNLDLELLYKIDAPVQIDNEYKTLSEMERFGKEKIKGIYDFTEKKIISCIWYNNGYYEGDIIRNVLQSELNEKGLKKIILGHWQNKILNFEYNKDYIPNKYFENNNVLRIDRSHVLLSSYPYPLGNLGYAILDKDNTLLEVGDFPGNDDFYKNFLF